MITQNRVCRRCDVCHFDVHRASYAKHLRIYENVEIMQFNPFNFFKEANKIKPNVFHKPGPSKQIAGQKI